MTSIFDIEFGEVGGNEDFYFIKCLGEMCSFVKCDAKVTAIVNHELRTFELY